MPAAPVVQLVLSHVGGLRRGGAGGVAWMRLGTWWVAQRGRRRKILGPSCKWCVPFQVGIMRVRL